MKKTLLFYPRKHQPLRESFAAGVDLSSGKVDIENGVLRDVKVWGLVSKNGYEYTPEGLKARLQEADKCLVYIGHDHSDNPARDNPTEAFGLTISPYMDEKGEMRVKEFRWNTSHTFHESFKWWIQNAPDKVGFSPNAVGDLNINRNTNKVYATPTKLNSIDMVCGPATTGSLLESTMETVTGQSVDEMLGQLTAAIVQDTSMSVADKKAKLMQILKMLDDGAEVVEETKEELTDDVALKEAAKYKNKVIRYLATRLKESTRLAEAGKKLPEKMITSVVRKALLDAKDEKEVNDIIAEQVKLTESLQVAAPKQEIVGRGPDTVLPVTKEWNEETRKQELAKLFS